MTEKHKLQKVGIDGSRLQIFKTIWCCVKKSEIKVDKISKKIPEILNQHEERWNQSQQEKLKQRLEEKLKKSARAKDYTQKLLHNCKSWGGPATSIKELKQSQISK